MQNETPSRKFLVLGTWKMLHRVKSGEYNGYYNIGVCIFSKNCFTGIAV
jgi:hypothetical protein